MISLLLAWRPFLDPINALHDVWWLLLIPMAIFVAVIYKALRIPNLRRLPAEATMLTLQIILGMLGLGLAIHVVAEVATHTHL
jgi:F420-0:gamma-glutamyl ligase-like protein